MQSQSNTKKNAITVKYKKKKCYYSQIQEKLAHTKRVLHGSPVHLHHARHLQELGGQDDAPLLQGAVELPLDDSCGVVGLRDKHIQIKK